MTLTLEQQLQEAEAQLRSLQAQAQHQQDELQRQLEASASARDAIANQLREQERIELEADVRQLVDGDCRRVCDRVNSAVQELFASLSEWRKVAQIYDREAGKIHKLHHATVYEGIDLSFSPWCEHHDNTPQAIGTMAIRSVADASRQYPSQPWLEKLQKEGEV